MTFHRQYDKIQTPWVGPQGYPFSLSNWIKIPLSGSLPLRPFLSRHWLAHLWQGSDLLYLHFCLCHFPLSDSIFRLSLLSNTSSVDTLPGEPLLATSTRINCVEYISPIHLTNVNHQQCAQLCFKCKGGLASPPSTLSPVACHGAHAVLWKKQQRREETKAGEVLGFRIILGFTTYLLCNLKQVSGPWFAHL